eukprot:TRINITY_DN2036_c0_g1_i3.p1 TRINITY_DN2036_c0_g1~~TRINITY_DN2036_c0_g1_i3.p1  ORF type:complete len:216 (-),score=48.69 TRINITY_DN2036_c0_g1_i3:172-819(-)
MSYPFSEDKSYAQQKIATAALFLAGKVEQTPAKVDRLLVETHKLLHHHKELQLNTQEFHDMKQSILQHEELLLENIGFVMKVEHPYSHLKQLIGRINGDRALAKIAYGFINDSLRTPLCLLYKPSCIAAAALQLAVEVAKFKMPAQQPLWEFFGESQPEFVDCVNHIMSAYEHVQEETVPGVPYFIEPHPETQTNACSPSCVPHAGTRRTFVTSY